MIPWVITREREDGEPLVALLKERGVDARCVPAIERRALPWPAALDDAPGAKDNDGALWFLTSPYAARVALAHLGERAASTDFAAIAPGTARVIEKAGAHVDVRAHHGVVSLARAVAESGFRGVVVYPTSDAGLDTPEQHEALAILEVVNTVKRAAVYTTSTSPTLAADLGQAPWQCVSFSPSAVQAIAAAVRAGAPAPAALACVGESTLRAHDEAPFAPASLVPRGVDVADYICAWPHLKKTPRKR